MSDAATIHVCWTIDCEATQKAVNAPALGERAVRGFAELIAAAGLRATLFVLPGDARAHGRVYAELARAGFEVGLHYHPQEEGHADYCGAYPAEEQRAMYGLAARQFADAVGLEPRTFRTGSCSANDDTFPVTADLGFTSCSHSMPARNMVALKSNWTGAPASVHFAHGANRLLEGRPGQPGWLDLVEAPVTTDPDSMLWSGQHPQDLRVELFDAKNQRYLIDKVLAREAARQASVRAIVVLTHNVFDFSDGADFRRQTMKQMIADFRTLAEKRGVTVKPATIGEIAGDFRKAMSQSPLPASPRASGRGLG